MVAQVIDIRRRASIAQLVCEACGATADAACNCGVAYVPAASAATKAIVANPEKSDRAIAAEIGVSDRTVNRARKSGATKVAPQKRLGKDGKKYPAKQKRRAKRNTVPKGSQPIIHPLGALYDPMFTIPGCPDCANDTERWHRDLGHFGGDAVAMTAYWDRAYGKGWRKFEVPSYLVKLAKQAAEEWTKLAAQLAKK